uniref:JNK1/MAPK8-associated membrane protein n=1 Tax=Caenorhabditis japonica TaxID=281687 RepID=A0A8R1HNP7_CAEJA
MSISSGHASTPHPPACLGFCGLINVTRPTSHHIATSATSAEFTKCGPCSFGYRNDARSNCVPCDAPLEAYDWMYLLFVALLPLLLHMQFVRAARKYCRSRYYEIAEHLCVLLENIIACIVSVLIYPPKFSFFLNGCAKNNIREWYPACYNPVIGFSKTMRCTYEVVFPLYSITFTHHLVLVVAILIFRTTLYCSLLYKTYNGKPFYYAMVSVPLLALCHSALAGVFFYTFPWILLIGSLWAMVHHLAVEGKRPLRDMIVRLTSLPHIVFLTITMLLLSFAIVAIIAPLELPYPSYPCIALALVPLPFVFYLLTMPFTNPATAMRLL